MRRIASNWLWHRGEMLRYPMLTLSDEGVVERVDFLSRPDESPFTEFYSGVMVLHFPENYLEVFDKMMHHRDVPLSEQLREVTLSEGGCSVLLSGLDYLAWSLTPRTTIQRLG